MLILVVCGIIRSLSRVLLGFVIRAGFDVECCVSVVFWVILCLFVLDLLGFGWSRVVR